MDDESTVDALRVVVAARKVQLGRIRPNRLNASAWRRADWYWLKSIDPSTRLHPVVASLLVDYQRARDGALPPAGQSQRETWIAHHSLSVRGLAVRETFWQVAGFITWRRFRA